MKGASHPMAGDRSTRSCGRWKRLFPFAAALLVAAGPVGADPLEDAPATLVISSNQMPGASAVNPKPLNVFGLVSAVAKDLHSPDGIARDAESGDIYVSEENKATIVRITPDGDKEVLFDNSTPLYEEKGYSKRAVLGLRSPEGVALDGKGTLYVVEDIPGGRLISFNVKGKSASSHSLGQVIPLPIENSRFAWESVDVGPAGELLIAGSTMEYMLGDSGSGVLFRGAILYRDATGEWWLPMNHAMASYSAACFSPDGDYAFFACEFTGDVGCLDLRSHTLRTYRSKHTFRSPEGVCALPRGSALVAEESGKIYWLDPVVDKVQLLYDNQSTIESVSWDKTQGRLLVTDDQQGILLSMKQRGNIDMLSVIGTPGKIPFEDRCIPVELIPDQCPKYLAKVLKLGGYDPFLEEGKVAFRDFARRYCLIAIDAEAELMGPEGSVEDPFTQIQFVVVAPYWIGIQEGELIWSSSGFTAVRKSGQKVKTELVQRQIIQGDLMESRFIPVGGQTIALPIPFSARINIDGTTAVNFMGMGAMPDFFLVLNTVETDQSIMVVMPPGSKPQQYKLKLPSNRDNSHWVVALDRKEPDVWRRLSFAP